MKLLHPSLNYLCDFGYSRVFHVYHIQEGLAAIFGNGLSTSCVVNMGAQVTSIVCVEVTIVPHIYLFFFFASFLLLFHLESTS